MIPIYVIVWLKINNAHGKGLKAFSMRIFMPLHGAINSAQLTALSNTSSKKGAGPF